MDREPIPPEDGDCDLAKGRAKKEKSETNDPAVGDPDDPRSSFDKDLDKLDYSEAFKRLEFITQVYPSNVDYRYHSRKSHVEKVAQVARAIANRLLAKAHDDADLQALIMRFGGLSPTVASAGAMIHDLGHPPFGHAGEEELQSISSQVWGVSVGDQNDLNFEGNGQNSRILLQLEAHKPKDIGIKLTSATMVAGMKYPWGYQPGLTKYSFYDTETTRALRHRRNVVAPELGNRRSLEAQIVDTADDMSYAVHDVEDFYRAGLIPLELVRQSNDVLLAELKEGVVNAWRRSVVPLTALLYAPTLAYGQVSPETLISGDRDDREFTDFIRRDLAWATGGQLEVETERLWTAVDSVRTLMGAVPDGEEIERAVERLLEKYCPRQKHGGDEIAIADLREFSAKMIGTLLGQVEFCDLVGARMTRDGQLVVWALKWLAERFVYCDPQLREMQDAQQIRLRVVADHFADILGLHIGSDIRESSQEAERIAQAKEAAFHDWCQKASRGDRLWLKPPTWPARFGRALTQVVETQCEPLPDGTEQQDEVVRRRRERGRLLIDMLATFAEDELDELADALIGGTARRRGIRPS